MNDRVAEQEGWGRRMLDDYKVGDVAFLDDSIPVEVTQVGVYVGRSMTRREVGVSVRPEGGRARPVSLSRLSRR